MAQTLIGGSSDADVSYLFLWVYGWVGLAIVSALIGPLWSWLDPFSTLHDLGAALLRRTGVEGLEPQPYPARLGIWPAIGGLCFFIWLELVARVNGGQVLGFVLIGYTIVTLVGMAQYGKAAWRRNGETFSVWFGILGRLAPFGLVGEPEDRTHPSPAVRERPGQRAVDDRPRGHRGARHRLDPLRRSLPDAPVLRPVRLPEPGHRNAAACGLSGDPGGLVLLVGRRVGLAAMGAGLVPVALGYLIAHYFTASSSLTASASWWRSPTRSSRAGT